MAAIDTTALSSPGALADFFTSQLQAMPAVAERYSQLTRALVKEVCVGGRRFVLQCNPAREVSSSAKVDADSVQARPCFLCKSNRLPGQQSLDLGAYELLVNPFPIFPHHFTIPAREHTPQLISGRVGDMAALALAMPGFTIFYNGPCCGASAPDHFHFQAGDSDRFNLPDAPSGLTEILILRASTPQQLQERFNAILAELPPCEPEPMLNLLCRADGSGLRLWVMPRVAHRPDFYGTAEGCMLLSPASVDLGGLFIFPRKADFDRADASVIERTLLQVCPPAGSMKFTH